MSEAENIAASGCKMDNQDGISEPLSRKSEEVDQLRAEVEKLRRERAQERLVVGNIISAVPGLLWFEDALHRIQVLSDVADFGSELDLPWTKLKEQGWLSVMPLEERYLRAAWQNNIEKGEAFSMDVPLQCRDGRVLWFRLGAHPAAQSQVDMPLWYGFCRCIEDEKRTEAVLKTALKTRADFVAHISHELRTPLNGILPMIEMLLRADLSSDARAHVLTLKDAGNCLLNIINNVLDFSRLEAGKIEPGAVEFEVLGLVERVAQIFSPAAAAKGLLLVCSVADNVPERITGDPQRLSQALSNLCGNAVKFTEEGMVLLSVKYEKVDGPQNRLTFSVADTGPGISEEMQKHLFEPFFQGSGSSYREQAGSGLGLSITKRLVELLGGSAFVQSEPGEGSIFGFSIPVSTGAVIVPIGSRMGLPQHCGVNDGLPMRKRVLTFEPVQRGHWAIAEAFRCLDVRVESTDNIAAALGMLKRSAYERSGEEILVLDLVRFRKKSEELIQRILAGELINSVRLVEVVSVDMHGSDSLEQLGGERLLLPVPLKRLSLLNCLNAGALPRLTQVRSKYHAQTLVMDTSPQTHPESKLRPTMPKKFVLVADDNQINRQVAAIFLTDLGFEVSLAGDGVEAVQAFKARSYDMVFLDCQMPRIDGFEVAAIIKEIQHRRGITVPIIALTANAMEGAREECLANGMDDYLSKPIDPVSLERLVENWLGRVTKKVSFTRSSPRLPKLDAPNSSGVNVRNLLEKFSESQASKVLETFVETSLAELREFEGLLLNFDQTELERRLRSFRNTLLTIEAPELAMVCADAESAVRRQDAKEARALLSHLAGAVEKLQGELNQALADRSTFTLPTIKH